ncbi:AFH_G0017390.mRNA.1.CDS.1 [Saccharomyces cerevisiae]|nr:AFH_G0017390.mRNA.1.CDS.1 [Saccharomyces cerevisiae]CAI6646709.1 AFH_G0017390.mRNA.1.CDS.1 [Saccharomyces cerevisiae]
MVASRARENQRYSQCRKSTIFPLGFAIISGYIQFQNISILHISRFNSLFYNIFLSIFKNPGTTIQLESTLYYHEVPISPIGNAGSQI